MDELPSEAKSVLELAKGAQEGADLATRHRVRARVEAAVAATALSQGERSTSFGRELGGAKNFLTTTKIMLASGALLFGASTALWSTGGQVASHNAAPAADEPLPEARAQTKSAELLEAARRNTATPNVPAITTRQVEAREQSQIKARVSAARNQTAAGEPALAAEMALLSQAADALENKDVGKARTALNAHRQRFSRPQLREERDGLSVLARCLERPDSAQGEALSFVQKSPASILATRIKQACGLSDGT